MGTTPLYDTFSSDHDRFVDWPGRLAHELPFIEAQLATVGAHRVLDAACGTGRHALALGERDYQVVGADLSVGMIEQANGDRAPGSQVAFVVAGFGELAERVGTGFDALLCLGNSLPHMLTAAGLREALHDFAAVLRPGGLLLVQNRNFDAVLANANRWMEPQAHREGEQDWLFVRFYDFNPDGSLTFHVLTLRRAGPDEPWQQQAAATTLRPWRHRELASGLRMAGFGGIAALGDVNGTPFDVRSSGNLILTAVKA